MRIYRTLLHSLDNHGFSGTLARIFARVAGDRPAAPPPGAPEEPHPFDRLHGTETGGWIPGERLVSGLRADLYNTAYYGISPSTLREALVLLGPVPRETTFVDLGCGKGRALLTASEFPFAHLLGVDLSQDLCAAARANARQMSLSNVTVLQQDAASLVYPDCPLVIFLYHPFLAPVLRRVLRNFGRQRAGSRHPTWLLYANPQYPGVLASAPFLRAVWDYNLRLSAEDELADRFGTVHERYALFTVAQAV